MFDCKRLLDEVHDWDIVGILGKARSGKTTIAAGLVKENEKRKNKGKGVYFDRIYCTDETIQGTIPFKYKQFGTWNIKDNSLIILEESGIGLQSRNWKNISDLVIRTTALIGHHKSTILYSSQRPDTDICLRERSQIFYIVEKLSKRFSLVKTISYKLDVDNDAGTMVNKYHKPEGLKEVLEAIKDHDYKFIYRKQYYNRFDSFNDDFKYPGKDPEDILKEKEKKLLSLSRNEGSEATVNDSSSRSRA